MSTTRIRLPWLVVPLLAACATVPARPCEAGAESGVCEPPSDRATCLQNALARADAWERYVSGLERRQKLALRGTRVDPADPTSPVVSVTSRVDAVEQTQLHVMDASGQHLYTTPGARLFRTAAVSPERAEVQKFYEDRCHAHYYF